SLAGFSGNTELNAGVFGPHCSNLVEWFEEIWEESEDFNPLLLQVIKNSWAYHKPGLFPLPYLVLIRGLYELYRDFIEADKTGGLLIKQLAEVLYDFQLDAAKRAVKIIEKYGGVLISDVVGLGKTYIALAVAQDLAIKHLYEGKEHRVAVIAPAHLVDYWREMLKSYGIEGEVFSAGLLPYEDRPSFKAMSEYIKKAGIVIVDESHNYTNTTAKSYTNLQELLSGKKAILLTATPYRKRYTDILNQIRLFIHGSRHPFPLHPPTWEALGKAMENGQVDPSYVLREIMVRRTRYDILNLYGGEGNCLKFGDKTLCFPERELKTVTYSISDTYNIESIPEEVRQILIDGISDVNDVYELLVSGISTMTYARFNLYEYVHDHLKDKSPYTDLSAAGRNLRGLMKILFLKRLESSWYAFWWTLYRSKIATVNFLKFLDHKIVPAGEEFEDILLGKINSNEVRELSDDEIEQVIEEIKPKYKAGAFKIEKLKEDLRYDLKKIEAMIALIEPLKTEIERDVLRDAKFSELLRILEELMSNGKRKILVFSEFSETVEWIYKALETLGYTSKWSLAAVSSKTRGILDKVRRFAPKANAYATTDEIDILIATDVLSEGLNLQDANTVINYDLHWTPVKLIQRIGRVDRIGTEHDVVEVYNFFPETKLDKKLGLIEKISKRVEDFNRSLGSDGKILSEMDEWNPSAIAAIYGGDISAIEEFESRLGISVTTEAEKLVREFMEKYPEEFEKLKKVVSMRSACEVDNNETIAFFVCSDGVITQYYSYVYTPTGWMSRNDPLEKILKIASIDYETPAATNLDMDLYYSAAKLALEDFNRMRKEVRGTLVYQKKRIPNNIKIIFTKLLKYSTKLKTPGEKEEIKRVIELAQWGYSNDNPFAGSLRKIKNPQRISAEKIFEAVRALLEKHNIAAKKQQLEKRIKEQGEEAIKPHIVAGLIFLPRTNN
ncbi:DNA helicase, partial [Archaeoglobales archaeon]